MSDAEEKILKIYDGSLPVDEDLYETSNVNHLAWSLAILMFGLVLWLAVALINAENQRYALMTKKCVDPMFKEEVDKVCMQTVQSRPHWWEHLWYGLTHLQPESQSRR